MLGVLGLALAAVVVRTLLRRPADGTSTGPEATPDGFRDDDLPGFLERPPGSAPGTSPSHAGWAVLTSPPAPVEPAPVRRPGSRWTAGTVALAVLAALLLIGALICAAVAATAHRPAGSAHAARAASRGADVVSGDLSFGGVVLERHVVGVTATYPRVRLTRGISGLVAHVELPTYNCLATEAPADPVAARCARSVPEYADLPAPALKVSSTTGGRLRLTGRFPTVTRPGGGPAVRTGRVYELLITAGPADGRSATGRTPASGELRLGDDRAATTGVSVLRFGD